MAIEDTMAQLANSQVIQSMPSLKDYIHGFQLVESDEDNNIVTGVLVALLGDTCIFIPTNYKNGKIAPLDIMYIPDMDQFLPAQDNFISYLKSKKPDLLAKNKGPREWSYRDNGSPRSVRLDLPFLMITKMASDDTISKYEQRVGTPALLKAAGETMLAVKARAEQARKDLSFGVPSFMEVLTGRIYNAPMAKIAADAGVKMLNTLTDFPETSNVFARYYSNDDIDKFVEKLTENVKLTMPPGTEPEKPEGTVKVLTSASAEAKQLSDAEKKKIIKDGAVIKDSRGLTPTLVYKAKQNNEWQTVSTSGMYELLKMDGNTLTAYVITGIGDSNKPYAANVVIPVDDGKARKAVVCSRDIIGQAYPPGYIELPGGISVDKIKNTPKPEASGDGSELPADYSPNSYIVTDTDGSTFVLNGDLQHGVWQSGSADLYTGLRITVTRPGNKGLGRWGNVVGNQVAQDITTIQKMPASAKLRIHGNVLYVPETAKFYPFDQWFTNDSSVVHGNVELNLATLDNAKDVINRRGTLKGLKIFHTDGVYTLSDADGNEKQELDKTAAAFRLVKDYAITPDDAEAMVKEASAHNNHQVRYLLKVAADASFAMAMEDPGQNPYVTDTETADMDAVMAEEDRKRLDEAAATGIKDVVDVSVLKSLATDGSTVRLIQEYIPDLFTAMDRVARMLYLTRSGNSMEAAYGDSKVDLLEGKLRKLVAELGDLIIFLQQGRIDEVRDLIEGPLAASLG